MLNWCSHCLDYLPSRETLRMNEQLRALCLRRALIESCARADLPRRRGGRLAPYGGGRLSYLVRAEVD
jgi:hypothetical protein